MNDGGKIALEELVAAYRAGDDTAFDKIFERCSYIVRHVSRKYFLMGADAEDLMQEGFLGLLKAVRTYEEGKSSFTTYAALCINTAVITAVRRYAGDKNRVLNEGVPISDDAGKVPNPEDILIEDEGIKELIKKINEELSEMEREVFALYLQGLSNAEIRDRLDLSAKATDNALQRIRNKIRKFAEER